MSACHSWRWAQRSAFWRASKGIGTAVRVCGVMGSVLSLEGPGAAVAGSKALRKSPVFPWQYVHRFPVSFSQKASPQRLLVFSIHPLAIFFYQNDNKGSHYEKEAKRERLFSHRGTPYAGTTEARVLPMSWRLSPYVDTAQGLAASIRLASGGQGAGAPAAPLPRPTPGLQRRPHWGARWAVGCARPLSRGTAGPRRPPGDARHGRAARQTCAETGERQAPSS